jgi:pimeloyl-ACP methyl ester carboxylesterase
MSISTLKVSVRGVRSPALTAGPPDGAEAVVFVHGNPGPAEDWRDLLTRAGELGRAIAPDMPGYGRADKPKDFRYSVDGYAEYLAALLDQLGITRAHRRARLRRPVGPGVGRAPSRRPGQRHAH